MHTLTLVSSGLRLTLVLKKYFKIRLYFNTWKPGVIIVGTTNFSSPLTVPFLLVSVESTWSDEGRQGRNKDTRESEVTETVVGVYYRIVLHRT